MSEKLSENFTRSEFACPVSGLCRVSNRLLGALERLRKLSGDRRIFVTRGGGCRSWEYNQDLVRRKGASPTSEHLVQKLDPARVPEELSGPAITVDRDCRAADIHIEGLTVPEMYWLALSVPDFNAEGGIGVYPQNGFIHVDVRGHAARWMWKDGQSHAIPDDFAKAPQGFDLGGEREETVAEGAARILDLQERAARSADSLLMAMALISSGMEDLGRAIAQLQRKE